MNKKMIKHKTFIYINNILIISIITISIISLLGYLLKTTRMYDWGYTPMAINTAASFFLVGIVLFLINNYKLFIKYESE